MIGILTKNNYSLIGAVLARRLLSYLKMTSKSTAAVEIACNARLIISNLVILHPSSRKRKPTTFRRDNYNFCKEFLSRNFFKQVLNLDLKTIQRERLRQYLEAEEKILLGQEYVIGSRTFRRPDLEIVR